MTVTPCFYLIFCLLLFSKVESTGSILGSVILGRESFSDLRKDVTNIFRLVSYVGGPLSKQTSQSVSRAEKLTSRRATALYLSCFCVAIILLPYSYSRVLSSVIIVCSFCYASTLSFVCSRSEEIQFIVAYEAGMLRGRDFAQSTHISAGMESAPLQGLRFA